MDAPYSGKVTFDDDLTRFYADYKPPQDNNEMSFFKTVASNLSHIAIFRSKINAYDIINPTAFNPS